jgi:DNA-binding NarL/FixJ family response regulator
MTVRILVADDHEIVRLGVKYLLQATDIKIIAEAATGAQAVKLALKHEPNLVLLDVRMPEGDGLNSLGRIKLDRPNMPVLMLSAYDNPAYFTRAIALGACGYLAKDVAKKELVEAIRQAATGQSLWLPEQLRRVTGASATMGQASDNDVPLSPREGEVLQQLALGLTNKEIARSLQISYETVKEHVQRVLQKIGVTDRTQAAVWAVRKGLV